MTSPRGYYEHRCGAAASSAVLAFYHLLTCELEGGARFPWVVEEPVEAAFRPAVRSAAVEGAGRDLETIVRRIDA